MDVCIHTQKRKYLSSTLEHSGQYHLIFRRRDERGDGGREFDPPVALEGSKHSDKRIYANVNRKIA